MDSNTLEFIINKTKIFLIVSIFIAAIITILFGFNMGLNYYYGFFIGVLNFIGLSIGTSKTINNAAEGNGNGKRNQTIFFFFRYFLVAGLLIISIKYLNANVFALVIGLLTIHMSLLISAIPNYIEKRKEG